MGDYLERSRDMIQFSLHSANNGGELFYTNASESVNKKLKAFRNFKSSSLFTFLESIKSFIECEEGKATDGYIGHSQLYQISELFRRTFGEIVWEGRTEKQWKNLLTELACRHPVYSTQSFR